MLTLQKTASQAACNLSALAPEASLREGERKSRQKNHKNMDGGHDWKEYSDYKHTVAEGMDGGWQNQLEHEVAVV